jgi:condensin complex subunit 3
MLDTAMCLDYADEAGRRRMYELLRDILKSYELIDDHLAKIVRIFRLISLDERDFTRTIIEIISDIQEQINPFDELEETPSKRSRLDIDGSSAEPPTLDEENSSQNMDSLVVRLRCLNICKRMLENSQEVN